MQANAYLNWGRFVADCPADYCTNALEVQLGQDTFTCRKPPGCGTSAPLQWPADPAQVAADLAGLPPAQQSQPFPGTEPVEPIEDAAP